MSRAVHALVRPPDASFIAALGQHPEAASIDVGRAQAQHHLYVAALRAAGVRVDPLPPAPGYPDACFVQDVVMLLPRLAILGRPAEPSRQGEVDLIRPVLPRGLPVAAITAPGTLEWGDVLRIGDTLYVGRSARTNAAAAEQLAALVAPLGLAVEALPVPQGLHLLSGVNYLGVAPAATDGPDVLVAWEEYATLPPFAGLDVIVVPPDETPAANCLAIGDAVITPAGYPHTAAAIWHRGFRVFTVPIDEFAKADGGVTCLSVLNQGLSFS
jgi:dimethylargininase